MKTESSCYTTVPQACAPPLGYHPYPPGTAAYHTPPLSAYSYLLAPPPPSVMGMASGLASGYPPPTTTGHNQLPPPLPPGMPPVSGISRGTWMRWVPWKHRYVQIQSFKIIGIDIKLLQILPRHIMTLTKGKHFHCQFCGCSTHENVYLYTNMKSSCRFYLTEQC